MFNVHNADYRSSQQRMPLVVAGSAHRRLPDAAIAHLLPNDPMLERRQTRRLERPKKTIRLSLGLVGLCTTTATYLQVLPDGPFPYSAVGANQHALVTAPIVGTRACRAASAATA